MAEGTRSGSGFLGRFAFPRVDQQLKLFRAEFGNSHHLQSYVLETFFVGTVYQDHSHDIGWMFALVEPNQHAT